MVVELIVVMEAVNVLLLIFLLKVYVQNYIQMKSGFSLGLILFSLILLLQNVMAGYFHFAMVDYYSVEAMGQSTALTILETVALAVLAWVTWRE
ncbi:MAG: hypothetical protein J4224_03050 [Candidatus Diapherotrites archaeon]|uniref:Uncharacterized protein n=1 Tax=Candidatus Iainarchaeum sp. TaxID=3101447 RepID=A0A7J4IY33_9ARCH|nr:MAG: hypothetical protein QT03_C0001G0448 [archaeon GW2011_AR10]MBS3059377.1 hypothetical protein [Candidatus Diapherotrites archaeon]HIH08707.1 hypothetical protein [Candidatus Diapherotrites archaeon]